METLDVKECRGSKLFHDQSQKAPLPFKLNLVVAVIIETLILL